MLGLIKKIFGTAQDRLLKKYAKIVTEINKIEEELQKLTEEEVINKTDEFRERYKNGETTEDLLPEAYAVVKNICRRLCGTDTHIFGYDQKWDMIPYDVQLLGAIALHYGSIAEMQTGEGKTLTAALPLYLNAITGKATHLVTVNDYLAKRDCEWIGTIYKKLKLTTASLTNDVPVQTRKEVYGADIVYGTASEFGFDYLRDNSMATSKEDQVQRGFYFAIVDEIDSILIDEARTPLIISGPSPISKQMYDELKGGVAHVVRLQRDQCNKFAVEAKKILDDSGIAEEGKFRKPSSDEEIQAFKNLWLVGKGTPRNKVLKRIKENPDLRAEIDGWEIYFCSDQTKAERAKLLTNLYIIVDERASEFELTDKGIQSWSDFHGDGNDFVMLDLGHEYALIDQDGALSEEDKIQKKLKLREDDALRKERAHNLRQLFRAHLLMEKDVDYIVQDNTIIIIDENTGRPQPGRRFSDGLHQSIEAKESVPIQKETQTYATITLQNYFRMYDKLAGMTGTAITEANEFKEIYKLEVLEIPTYCNSQRADTDDEIYMTEREKYTAILKEIKNHNAKGQPILIGTESVEISEKLSRILKQNKLEHVILNAKNHAKEAEIIAEAGNPSAITLATNMAGRGTDIKLKPQAKEAGGLHVIGTTRHHSRRIDRQLRGRSGRLGDPGSSKFFVSFEDSLMRLFASPRVTYLLKRFRPPEGEPISAKILNKSIETAQKRIEQRNYMIRKHTLEYDDVMNKQRKEVYSFRNELLYSSSPIDIAKDLINQVCIMKTEEFLVDPSSEETWRVTDFIHFLMEQFPVTFDATMFDEAYSYPDKIKESIYSKVVATFDAKLERQKRNILAINPQAEEEKILEVLNEVVRNLIIHTIDMLWQEHLLGIDHLRSDVHLRTVGQKDPLLEFKQEAFLLFSNFSKKCNLQLTRDLFRFEMVSPQEERVEEAIKNVQLHTQRSFLPSQEEPSSEEEEKELPITSEKRSGRNDLCPCGSGKKFKKCCGIQLDVPLF